MHTHTHNYFLRCLSPYHSISLCWIQWIEPLSQRVLFTFTNHSFLFISYVSINNFVRHKTLVLSFSLYLMRQMTTHPPCQIWTRTVSIIAHCLQFTGNFIQNKSVMPDLVTLSNQKSCNV